MSEPIIVTVDGPAGSGKSTLGRALARQLRVKLIDTGLLYRGVMVAAVRAGLDGTEPTALGELAARTDILISTDPSRAGEHLEVDGRPAGALLRDPQHARLLATISSTPAVRAALLPRQRALAAAGAVAVGRDCGTVVFPGAAVKFYLDAPQAVRSRRRAEQLSAAGEHTDTAGVADVAERDRIDSARAVSPLRPADDAVAVDTSTMGIEAMIAGALRVLRERGIITDEP